LYIRDLVSQRYIGYKLLTPNSEIHSSNTVSSVKTENTYIREKSRKHSLFNQYFTMYCLACNIGDAKFGVLLRLLSRRCHKIAQFGYLSINDSCHEWQLPLIPNYYLAVFRFDGRWWKVSELFQKVPYVFRSYLILFPWPTWNEI